MLCEKCGKQEATYHSTVNLNGVVTESHLCSDCAIGESKLHHMFNVGNFFKPSLFELQDDIVSKVGAKPSGSVCKTCGKTYDDFLKTGLLGCADCYHAFASDLIPVIKTMQFDVHHVGKQAVENEEFLDETAKTIQNLQFKLKQAVATENYELASDLKKQINDLKAQEEAQDEVE